MKQLIRISAEKNKKNLPTIREIISLIPNGEKLFWKIYWFEAYGEYKSVDAQTLEKQIENKKGMKILYDNLLELGDQLDQIIWITIVGFKEDNDLNYAEISGEASKYPVILEMIDGCYWELTADIENVELVKIDLENKYIVEYDIEIIRTCTNFLLNNLGYSKKVKLPLLQNNMELKNITDVKRRLILLHNTLKQGGKMNEDDYKRKLEQYRMLSWALNFEKKIVINIVDDINIFSKFNFDQIKDFQMQDRISILYDLDLYFVVDELISYNEKSDLQTLANLDPVVISARRKGLEWLFGLGEKATNDYKI